MGDSTDMASSSGPSLTIAFVGLGVMGGPMATHLVRRGHSLRVYNRTPAKAVAWHAALPVTSAQVSLHDSPQDAAREAEVVVCCVGNDGDVEAVVAGPQGVLRTARPGTVIVDHTTTSATSARAMSTLAAQRQCAFVDAPVSGGNIGAINGTLSIMCGGDANAFERVRPVIEAYSKVRILLGSSGSGQLAKMVNQICVAGAIQGLAEGLAFGMRAGLDMEQVLQLVGQGAAQSWQMVHRGPTMLRDEFDFGFAVDWMRKDLGLCLAQAGTMGASLPVTALIEGYYARLQAQGGGRWDTSSLIRLLR